MKSSNRNSPICNVIIIKILFLFVQKLELKIELKDVFFPPIIFRIEKKMKRIIFQVAKPKNFLKQPYGTRVKRASSKNGKKLNEKMDHNYDLYVKKKKKLI